MRISAVLAAVGFLVSIVGCQDSSNPMSDVSDNGKSSGGIYTVGSDSTTVAVVQAFKIRMEDSYDTTITFQTGAQGEFLDSSLNYVGVGALSLNGSSIPAVVESGDTLLYQIDSASLSFTGSNNYFSFTGGWDFPSMADTVPSPTGETVISAPDVQDTIFKSSGLTVYWNAGSADTAYIQISSADTTGGAVTKVKANTGSCSFSPSELASLPSGHLRITVAKANFKRKPISLSGDRKVLFIVYTAHSLVTNLQ